MIKNIHKDLTNVVSDKFSIMYIFNVLEYSEMIDIFCGGTKMAFHNTTSEAKQACDSDINCLAIMNRKHDCSSEDDMWLSCYDVTTYTLSGKCAWIKKTRGMCNIFRN